MRSQQITKILLITLVITLTYGIGLYFIIKEGNVCDEHVILNDKEEYDCRHVSSFSNGMSSIKFCDGTEMTVPTHRIIKVIKIK
jgi:hypothetical protein